MTADHHHPEPTATAAETFMIHTPSRVLHLLAFASRGPFTRLNRLPVPLHVTRRRHTRFAEDVWMTPNDLAHEPILHIGQIEVAALLRNLGVQHHLQEHVTELLGKIGDRSWTLCFTRGIERHNSVVQLPGLFDEVLRE